LVRAWRQRVFGTLLALLVTSAAAAQQAFDPELRARLAAAAADASSFEDRFDATVWLTDMSLRLERQVPDPEERVEILRLAHAEASKAELPPELVLAVIDVESNFDRFALSHAGARGLMQVMPFWLDELGRPDDNLFRIDTNLRYGCTILRFYLDREKGDLIKALARYNGSVGKRWYADRVIDKLRLKWFQQ
jgi:soluble lytic murein transglycosylase-like protein